MVGVILFLAFGNARGGTVPDYFCRVGGGNKEMEPGAADVVGYDAVFKVYP